MAHLRASAIGEELVEAVQATPEDTASDLADLAADEAQTLQAIAVLQAGGKGAYKQALVAAREDTGEWWQQMLERDGGEEAYSPSAASLLRFLQEEVRPRYDESASRWGDGPCFAPRLWAGHLDLVSWRAWRATRSTLTASWSACSPCCSN